VASSSVSVRGVGSTKPSPPPDDNPRLLDQSPRAQISGFPTKKAFPTPGTLAVATSCARPMYHLRGTIGISSS
jgi:hypothetical protein